ncbi:MAG: hypothetical protein V4574_01505 [Pseudomonadota bacterium]
MPITALFKTRPAWHIAAATPLAAASLLSFATPGAAQRVISAPTPPASTAAAECPPLEVDVREGTVNGIGPATPFDDVSEQLPCFTGQTAEGELFNYGGGVFYGDHNVYFYTYLRFIEIREPFAGTLRPAIFGRSKAALAAEFPFNGRTRRPLWGTPADEFVSTSFGCTQFSFTGDAVTQIRFYTRDCDVLYQPR